MNANGGRENPRMDTDKHGSLNWMGDGLSLSVKIRVIRGKNSGTIEP
jgi:hypothetical protein